MSRCLALLLLPFVLTALPADKEVGAWLVVGDAREGARVGQERLQDEPDNRALWFATIKALAAGGREKEMYDTYRLFEQRFGRDNRLIEEMAWGVLETGSRSPISIVRIYAMIGAFYAQDIRGIKIIHSNLFENNAQVRWVAVQLAAENRDRLLQEAVLQLVDKERNPVIRPALIGAIGKMQIKKVKPFLIRTLESSATTPEEKEQAATAIVQMSDRTERDELLTLVQSNRAALRSLAPLIVAHFEQKEHIELIRPLLNDTNLAVRRHTIKALDALDAHDDRLRDKLSDGDGTVRLFAAWALLRTGDATAKGLIEEWMVGSDAELASLASGAAASSGEAGLPLMRAHFRSHNDPYVRVNLALGLIGMRTDVDEACRVIAEALDVIEDRVMWREGVPFQALQKSVVRHNAMIPQYPEAVNQMTRMELIGTLAVLRYPGAKEAMLSFLKRQPWGVSGMATALLLTEGEPDGLDVAEELLSDPSWRVRVQAALVLALWGRKERAIDTLESSYNGADRETREKILEGIGRIGDTRSIAFLVDRLDEPNQTVRQLAAMALLQCLYH